MTTSQELVSTAGVVLVAVVTGCGPRAAVDTTQVL